VGADGTPGVTANVAASASSANVAAIATNRRGQDRIGQPLLNTGTGFDRRERDLFGLNGLLPAGVASIEDQVALELEHVRRKVDVVARVRPAGRRLTSVPCPPGVSVRAARQSDRR
jgi:hypothetical protein